MAFVVPAHGAWEKLYYGTGLKLYDRLAGRWGLGASRLLSRGETLESLPNIKEKGLRGGVRYFDAQFNDSRLALSLMLACLAQGGTPLNYFPVRSLIKEGNRVRGVVAEDGETGIAYPIRARVVINATGIHTDLIRKLDRPECADMMTASQGAHLVLPREFLPGDHAIMIPKTDDGRVLFAIPWLGRVLVGTTDTPVPGPADEPAPMDEEVQYLLEHCGRIFERAPRREDLLSIYAGIRPLARGKPGAKTSRISRNHVVEVSPNGLVTITGGKWTTYRQMAEDAVDAAAEVGGLERKGCRTRPLVRGLMCSWRKTRAGASCCIPPCRIGRRKW
jgi:glycerol-3-phosphate dehydrogenase